MLAEDVYYFEHPESNYPVYPHMYNALSVDKFYTIDANSGQLVYICDYTYFYDEIFDAVEETSMTSNIYPNPTSDFVNTEWIDSLKTNEKNIYEDCIKGLKQKMYHIPHNNHSKITFKHEAIDLGEVRINEKDSCLFTFINRGDTPAIIYKVKSTCGCTVAEWAKTPIQKGDSSHIKIVFKGESNGFFKKRIKVFTNSDNPETTLTISGTVIF